MLENEATKRKPRKKGQKKKSSKHSDLYTDEDPKGTIHGLGFKDAATARAGVAKVNKAKRKHAHKVQATLVMKQRGKVAIERTKDPEKKKNLRAANKIWSDHLEKLKKKTKKMNENLIRSCIREQLAMDLDSKPTPPEKEFVDGPDQLAGYIVVRDSHDRNLIAYAPITRTDGPDRPYLVRTTDTSWNLPFGLVRAIYPEVQDVFNHVDSKESWVDLGPGDRGEVGLYEWEWSLDEPSA